MIFTNKLEQTRFFLLIYGQFAMIFSAVDFEIENNAKLGQTKVHEPH